MPARYDVGLVEQSIADFAGEVCSQAVELGPQRPQLLCRVSRPLLCPIVRLLQRTSSDLLGRGASSAFFTIFCLRLSLLAGREPGRSFSAPFTAARLAAGVAARALELLEGMVWGCCELLAACADVMVDVEFLGRADDAGAGVGGEGARVFMAGRCHRWQRNRDKCS